MDSPDEEDIGIPGKSTFEINIDSSESFHDPDLRSEYFLVYPKRLPLQHQGSSFQELCSVRISPHREAFLETVYRIFFSGAESMIRSETDDKVVRA